MPRQLPCVMTSNGDDDVLTRQPRVRFSCSELAPGSWLRRYLPPQSGWHGETTQLFAVLSVDAKRGGVLLKEASTGREITRRRGYLAMSAHWELL